MASALIDNASRLRRERTKFYNALSDLLRAISDARSQLDKYAKTEWEIASLLELADEYEEMRR